MIQPTVPLGPRILLATANALKESNAKAQKPMPWMTARSHIKKDPGDPLDDLAGELVDSSSSSDLKRTGTWRDKI